MPQFACSTSLRGYSWTPWQPDTDLAGTQRPCTLPAVENSEPRWPRASHFHSQGHRRLRLGLARESALVIGSARRTPRRKWSCSSPLDGSPSLLCPWKLCHQFVGTSISCGIFCMSFGSYPAVSLSRWVLTLLSQISNILNRLHFQIYLAVYDHFNS